MDLILILLVAGFGLLGMSTGQVSPRQDAVATVEPIEEPFRDTANDDPRPEPGAATCDVAINDTPTDEASADGAEATGVKIAEAIGAAAAASAETPPDAEEFEAEVQTPTGKFTTAAEVRMILESTRTSWVAVREYEGQDLVYFTNLLAWRCGLHRIGFAINDGPMQVFDAERCHDDTATPNAILDDRPYVAYPLGSVQSVSVRLLYDDLGEDTARYERAEVLMP